MGLNKVIFILSVLGYYFLNEKRKMKEEKVRMLLELVPDGAVIRLKEETLVECLMQKHLGMSHPCAEFISELNIFDHEPSQLPALSELGTKSDGWYFFYHRSLLYKKGKVWKRKTNEGGWHETGDPKKVIDVATRRILVFKKGPYNRGQRTGWTLHEFEIGDRSDLVVGCLMKNPVKPVNQKKANGKGESDNILIKREENSCKRELADNPGSTSDIQSIESEYDPSCLTRNPAKRMRTFDGRDLDNYQSSISEVSEVPVEEETDRDLNAQCPCFPWGKQSKERYSSVSSFNSDHLTPNHEEMQSPFCMNSVENIAFKVQQEGHCEIPHQPTSPHCQMQTTNRPCFTDFPSSSGSSADNMELQKCYTLENLTPKDILPQVNQELPSQVSLPVSHMQRGERHGLSMFSSSDGSTINCNEKENCANIVEENCAEVSSQRKTDQNSPHQPTLGNLPAEQETYIVDNLNSISSPEVFAGDVNLERPYSPIFSPQEAYIDNPLSFPSTFSCNEYEAQLNLWDLSHFDKHEPFDNESISKLSNDLDGYSLRIDDLSLQAIGGLPSNSA